MLLDIELPYKVLERICQVAAYSSVHEILEVLSDGKTLAEVFEIPVNKIKTFFEINCMLGELFNNIKQ